MDDEGCGVLIVFVALVVLLLGIPAFEGYHQTKTERFCLSHGYPRADWRWSGDNYCIKRVDQTDEVVPTRLVK